MRGGLGRLKREQQPAWGSSPGGSSGCGGSGWGRLPEDRAAPGCPQRGCVLHTGPCPQEAAPRMVDLKGGESE